MYLLYSRVYNVYMYIIMYVITCTWYYIVDWLRWYLWLSCCHTSPLPVYNIIFFPSTPLLNMQSSRSHAFFCVIRTKAKLLFLLSWCFFSDFAYRKYKLVNVTSSNATIGRYVVTWWRLMNHICNVITGVLCTAIKHVLNYSTIICIDLNEEMSYSCLTCVRNVLYICSGKFRVKIHIV